MPGNQMWPNPWPPPTPAPNPGLPWENTEGSVPAEAYKNSCWNDPQKPMVFWNPAVQASPNLYGDSTGVVGRAVYLSAVFDLRPELKGLFGGAPHAAPIRGRSGQYGAGVYLTVQFFGVSSILSLNVRVWAIEYGNVTDSTRPALLGTREDATSDFYDASGTSGEANSTILTLEPPSGLRFWRGGIVVDYTTGTLDDAPTDLLVAAFCG